MLGGTIALASSTLNNVKMTATLGNGSWQSAITLGALTCADLLADGATAGAGAAMGAPADRWDLALIEVLPAS